MSQRLRKGDHVIVISGRYKGQKGKLVEILAKQDRVRIEGIAVVKRHLKENVDRNFPKGGIVEKLGSIHISNVALVDPAQGKSTRIGYRFLEDGQKVRYAKRSGELLTTK